MDVLFLLLIFGLSYLFINSFKKRLSPANRQTLWKLYLFHIVFGTYYCFFVSGDSVGFWQQAKEMSYENFLYSITEQQGTLFIYALNYYPSNVLGLSYFTGTMLYSCIGFIGLTYFYIIAIELIPKNPKFNGIYLFPLLFFLPNLHFWSCAVGKDSLLFFCIGTFIYGLLDPYKRLPILILTLVLSYFIRPHITLFMLLGFGIAFFSGKNISMFRRILFFGLLLGIAIAIFPLVMKFARIEEASLDSFNKFSTLKASKDRKSVV